jgi:hypothetical protein
LAWRHKTDCGCLRCKSKGRVASDWRQITAKYDNECATCEKRLPAYNVVWWNRQLRVIRCQDCLAGVLLPT